MKWCLVVLLFSLLPYQARALDAFEIQVYEAEVNDPGKFGLELHLNTVVKGRQIPETDVEVPPNHRTHLTFEPSYGMTKWWELGAYLQFAYAAQTQTGGQAAYFGGYKLRSKFIRPKAKEEHVQLGFNIEVSHVPNTFEDHEWSSELRPIIAWENDTWLFDINPIVDWDLSGDGLTLVPDFEPAGKVRYNTGKGFGVGFEYYSGLGKINKIPAFQDGKHILYVIADLMEGGPELNFGIGRGLNSNSDEWVVKTILGSTF